MKIEARIGRTDLFRFMFYHMYMRPTGLIYLVVGLAALGAGIWFLTTGNSGGVFLIVISGVYFVLQPAFLYVKAGQQASDENIRRTTVYSFDSEGIHAEQEGQESTLFWEKVYKAVYFAGELIIYQTDVRANIVPLPRESADTAEVLEIIRENLPKKKIRGF
ncbi:MAG: YcxB family protein [Lachnospiraceae bacterium]|nr:YcxB family protein [Lachnospiraceae bacterium]